MSKNKTGITLEDLKESAEYIFKNSFQAESSGLCIVKIYRADNYLSFDYSGSVSGNRKIIVKTGLGGFRNLFKLGIVDTNTVYYNGVRYEGEDAKKIIEHFIDEEA